MLHGQHTASRTAASAIPNVSGWILNFADAWSEACKDAGLVSGEDVFLYPAHQRSPDGNQATYFFPGADVSGLDLGLRGAQLADFGAHRDSHRVILYETTLPDCALVLLLRHELEHAIHASELGGVELDPQVNVIHSAMGVHFLNIAADLVGSGLLYSLVPNERDANNAASRCWRRSHGPPGADMLSSMAASLVRQPGIVEPVGKLPLRLLAFAALFSDEIGVDEATRVFGANCADVSTFWQAVSEDEGIQRCKNDARLAVPDAFDIENAQPSPWLAWRTTAERLEDAYQRSRVLLGIARGPAFVLP